MAATSETKINNVITPLRLVDIDASLKKNGHILFCEADHDNPWDWHIISHTWSRDIRALSKAVGELISTNITTSPANYDVAINEDLYRAKFQAQNWLKELEEEGCESRSDELLAKAYLLIRDGESERCGLVRAYLSIKEFIEILYNQGVKKVWLDALCINQHSQAEKAREIPRMADYYKKSKACYVPINGFADEESGGRCKGACNPRASSMNVKRAIVELLEHRFHFWKTSVPSAYKWTSTCEDEDQDEVQGYKWTSTNEDQDQDEIQGYKWTSTNEDRDQDEAHEDTTISNCRGCGGVNDYRLPPDKELVELRWFNRVWTLQEFKLPRDNIYFIVQLESWMEEWLSVFIACNHGDAGEVSHKIESVFYWAADESNKGNIEKSLINDLRQIVPCRFLNHVRCCSLKGLHDISIVENLHNTNDVWNCKLLSRKLKHQQPRLYIFNTEVLFVVGCMAHAWRQMSGQHIPRDKVAPLYNRYTDLYRHIKGNITDNQTLHWAMNDICSRECHEDHSEDRILGLLGLLPLTKGMSYTITTGKKSPEEQLVDLAQKGVFHEKTLLHFCFQNFHSGRNLPGMSWIPDLTQQGLQQDTPLSVNYTPTWPGYENEYLAKSISVSLDGSITMRTRLLKGHMHPHGPSTLMWKLSIYIGSEGSDGMIRKSELMSQSLEFERDKDSDRYIIQRPSSNYFQYGSIYLPFKESSTHHTLNSFNCWMLPILQMKDHTLVWMICLSSSKRGDYVLHKIGTLQTFHKYVYLDPEFQGQKVKIGGFGKNLDEHVLLSDIL